MKAVIYARYSSDNQREESIEGQLRECTAYCVKNDITILRTYIDRALSAKTDNRPDFQRMVKDSAKGLFDVVIVWKLDRFARNRYDSAHYKAQLRKYGVKVLSATENISEGPEGIILESMLEGMAEYYSAELSEKVIRGHTENALKCKYNGGTPTFGYVIDKDMQYQLDPRTAPVVLEIFTRYDQGATLKEIMEEMRQKGAKTACGKQKGPGPPQGRGRLSADHKAVLWHLRGHDGWRERHQRQQGPEIPLLSLCKHQETKKLQRQAQEHTENAH